MFKVVSLKPIMVGIALVLISVVLGVGVVQVVSMDAVPKTEYVVVIDAGHGGRDEGCSGQSGVSESEINLSIAKKLKADLEGLGIKVVMTRCDGNGLYKSNVDNYKKSDMEERVKIIESASPDMVVSIHCNSYADSTVCGAQVYYHEGDEVGKGFAEAVQSQLKAQLQNARSEIGKGDYYLLKETDTPAIIVECGYLTNLQDEALLQTDDYQNRISYAIMCGIIKYFDLCGND